MAKRFWLVLLLIAVCMKSACAQTSDLTTIIAGSRSDVFNEVFAAEDGSILAAGYTSSSDGALSDRTKTGRSGWLCCLDESGSVKWNFCSRNSQNDEMLAPVVHDDGSITVLLRSDGHEFNQLDLIRLNREGEQIERKTLFKLSQKEAHCMLTGPKVFSGGYIVDVIRDDSPYEPIYHWFGFDGKLLRTSEGTSRESVMAVSQSHIIEEHDGAYWLCRIDENGKDTPLCRLPEGLKHYGLASHENGGAVVCGGRVNAEGRTGLLAVYDAKGNRTSAFRVDGWMLDKVLLCDGGYIISATRDGDEGCLLRMDESGGIAAQKEFLVSVSSYYPYIALVPDGRVALVSRELGAQTHDGIVHYDALLTMMDLQ